MDPGIRCSGSVHYAHRHSWRRLVDPPASHRATAACFGRLRSAGENALAAECGNRSGVVRRIGNASLGKAFGTKAAGVAMTTRAALGIGLVAAHGGSKIHAH